MVHGSPGEDIAVIMLGYEKEMNAMFRNQNQGLRRRFNVENPIKFADYDDKALKEILKAQAASAGLRFK